MCTYLYIIKASNCVGFKRQNCSDDRQESINVQFSAFLDSTFTKQFSRKLREIETHGDYDNIQTVVGQGTV